MSLPTFFESKSNEMCAMIGVASRMESTGVLGKIQVSEATAKLLVESGKSHWLIPREDSVKVSTFCSDIFSSSLSIILISGAFSSGQGKRSAEDLLG